MQFWLQSGWHKPRDCRTSAQRLSFSCEAESFGIQDEFRLSKASRTNCCRPHQMRPFSYNVKYEVTALCANNNKWESLSQNSKIRHTRPELKGGKVSAKCLFLFAFALYCTVLYSFILTILHSTVVCCYLVGEPGDWHLGVQCLVVPVETALNKGLQSWLMSNILLWLFSTRRL